jgi:large subunit ribosomal protein L35Ae
MKATIVNFRRNRHTTSSNHMIIAIEGVDNKEKAAKFVGKEISYNTGKRDIKGKIASTHGNSGAVRAIFETGMPGQSLGKEVKIN